MHIVRGVLPRLLPHAAGVLCAAGPAAAALDRSAWPCIGGACFAPVVLVSVAQSPTLWSRYYSRAILLLLMLNRWVQVMALAH